MKHSLTVELDEFGMTMLREEAARQGVTVAEIVRHAVLYYLSDRDSGRAATRVFPESVSERALSTPAVSGVRGVRS
jgi:hypothetical protein